MISGLLTDDATDVPEEGRGCISIRVFAAPLFLPILWLRDREGKDEGCAESAVDCETLGAAVEAARCHSEEVLFSEVFFSDLFLLGFCFLPWVAWAGTLSWGCVDRCFSLPAGSSDGLPLAWPLPFAMPRSTGAPPFLRPRLRLRLESLRLPQTAHAEASSAFHKVHAWQAQLRLP